MASGPYPATFLPLNQTSSYTTAHGPHHFSLMFASMSATRSPFPSLHRTQFLLLPPRVYCITHLAVCPLVAWTLRVLLRLVRLSRPACIRAFYRVSPLRVAFVWPCGACSVVIIVAFYVVSGPLNLSTYAFTKGTRNPVAAVYDRIARTIIYLKPDPILFCKFSIWIRSGSGTNMTQEIRLLFDSA